MKRVIVLGTGTNVGKTYVSEALARSLRQLAPSSAVACLKPVESGYDAPRSDAHRLACVSAGVALPAQHPLYALEHAVSPHLATRLAGLDDITVRAIEEWLSRWEAQLPPTVVGGGWCIIETAGALFSPLAPRCTNFDLARALDPALWILVAPDGLGVLHDTTATLATCRQRGREPDLLALSAARAADASTGTNAAELAALGIATPVEVIAHDVTTADQLARALLARA